MTNKNLNFRVSADVGRLNVWGDLQIPIRTISGKGGSQSSIVVSSGDSQMYFDINNEWNPLMTGNSGQEIIIAKITPQVINPNISYSIVKIYAPTILTLANPTSNNTRKTISLSDVGCGLVTVICNSLTFVLDSARKSVDLIFDKTNNVWVSVSDDIQYNPINKQVKLTGHATNEAFGTGLAFSSDGNTLAVGAPNTSPGFVNIYYRTNTSTSSQWSTTGITLVPANSIGANGRFGGRVALSYDGTILAVGANGDNTFQGAVYIFTKNLTTGVWTQQAKLVSINNIGAAHQGSSVALSRTGTRCIFGGPNDNTNVGKIFVFDYNGSSWSETTNFISTGTFGGATDTIINFGGTCAISADGHYIVAAAPASTAQGNVAAGIVDVWSDIITAGVFQEVFYDNTAGALDQYGTALAVDDTCTTFVATAVINMSTSYFKINTLSPQVSIVVARYKSYTSVKVEPQQCGIPTAVLFGLSIAISGDGRFVVVGAPQAPSGSPGQACVLNTTVFSGSTGPSYQTLTPNVLNPSNPIGNSAFGIFVAISKDGSVVAIGGAGDNTVTGAAWLYQ